MGRDRWDDEFDSYREDEDTYVYDQCCENCGRMFCPMKLPDTDPREARYVRGMRRRKEDAELRDGEPVWCIYWQKKKQGRRRR